MDKLISSSRVVWLGAAFFLVAFAAAGLRADAPAVKGIGLKQLVASGETVSREAVPDSPLAD